MHSIVESIQKLDIGVVNKYYEVNGEREGLVIFRRTNHEIEFDAIEDLHKEIRKVMLPV